MLLTEETYFWGAESKKWEPTFLTKARLGVQVPGSNHSPPPHKTQRPQWLEAHTGVILISQ